MEYLPRFGWEVWMVTPRMAGKTKAGSNVVETESRDFIGAMRRRLGVQPGASVSQRFTAPSTETPTTPPRAEAIARSVVRATKSVAAYPDEMRGWIRPAVRGAELASASHGGKPDVLLSTSPAVSSHVVASRLAKGWQTPWVADLRDLWSGNPYSSHFMLRSALDQRLEKRTFSRAAALTTVSSELASALAGMHDREVSAITNGFNPEEVRGTKDQLPRAFTISHTGGLYEGKRDPTALLLAVRRMIDAGEIEEDEMRIQFFGPRERWLDAAITRLDLASVAAQHDYVRWLDSIAAQKASHLLLLLSWDDTADRGTCPIKLFDYMAARRPVLSLGYQESAGSRIVQSCGLGASFSSHDVEGVRGFLSRAVAAAREREPETELTQEMHDLYSQVEMARRFAEVLDRVV